MELTDEQGTGVRIESEKPFEFSVLPYTCHEIEQAEHMFELPPVYATVLRVMGMQTGVGGDNSWGAWAHEPYIVRGDQPRVFLYRVQLLG